MDLTRDAHKRGGGPSGGSSPPASWLPLSFCIRGGGLLAQLAMHTSAPTSWHAVRDAKELLRSERRAWHTFGVYRRLGLPERSWSMHASAAASVAAAGDSSAAAAAAAAANLAGPGSVSCSTRDCGSNSCSSSSCSERDSTCSSSLRSLGFPLPKKQQQQQRRNEHRQAAGGRRVDSSMEHRPSDAEETSVSDSEDSSSSSLLSEAEGASVTGVCTAQCSEEGRSLPSAASSLLRFPRIFPGYHFPPQPSAVPSAFFHPLTHSNSGSSSGSSSSSKRSAAAEAGEPQMVPTSRIQLLQCMLADTAAATIQRCIRGYFTRLRFHAALVWRRLLQQQQQREHRAAVYIQSAWRRAAAREELFKRRTEAEIARKRQQAATKLQALWRMHSQQFAFQTERLTSCLLAVRRLAAIEIQRAWRGRAARKVLDEEWEAWVIKWVWDKPSAIVEVIGDFSSPPWTKRHLMTYCHIRECFVLALPRRPGRHELKFIVNGRYVCDGSQTVIADGSGHFNNLVRVRPSAPSQFRLIRQRLALIESKRRAMERSISSPALNGVTRPRGSFQQFQQQQQQQKLERFTAYSPSNRARRMSIRQDFLPPSHKQAVQQQQRAGEEETASLGGLLPLLQPEPPSTPSSAKNYAYLSNFSAGAGAEGKGEVEGGLDPGPCLMRPSSASSSNLAGSWQLTSICGGSDAVQQSRASSFNSDVSHETAPEGSFSSHLAEEGAPRCAEGGPPPSLATGDKYEGNTEAETSQARGFKASPPSREKGKASPSKGAPFSGEGEDFEQQQPPEEGASEELPDTNASTEKISSSSSSSSSRSGTRKEETQQALSALKDTEREVSVSEGSESESEQQAQPRTSQAAIVSPRGANKEDEETHAAPKSQQQQGEEATRPQREKEGPPPNLIAEGPGPPTHLENEQLLLPPAAAGRSAAAAAAAPREQELTCAAARGPAAPSSANRVSLAAATETTPFYTPRDASPSNASEETNGAAAAPAAAPRGRAKAQPQGRGGARRGHRRR